MSRRKKHPTIDDRQIVHGVKGAAPAPVRQPRPVPLQAAILSCDPVRIQAVLDEGQKHLHHRRPTTRDLDHVIYMAKGDPTTIREDWRNDALAWLACMSAMTLGRMNHGTMKHIAVLVERFAAAGALAGVQCNLADGKNLRTTSWYLLKVPGFMEAYSRGRNRYSAAIRQKAG